MTAIRTEFESVSDLLDNGKVLLSTRWNGKAGLLLRSIRFAPFASATTVLVYSLVSTVDDGLYSRGVIPLRGIAGPGPFVVFPDDIPLLVVPRPQDLRPDGGCPFRLTVATGAGVPVSTGWASFRWSQLDTGDCG